MPTLSTEESESRVAVEVAAFLEKFLHVRSAAAAEQLVRVADSVDSLLSCLLRDKFGRRPNDGLIIKHVASTGKFHLLVKGECWHIDQYKEPLTAELRLGPNKDVLTAYRIRFVDRLAGYGKDGLAFDYEHCSFPEREDSWEYSFDKDSEAA